MSSLQTKTVGLRRRVAVDDREHDVAVAVEGWRYKTTARRENAVLFVRTLGPTRRVLDDHADGALLSDDPTGRMNRVEMVSSRATVNVQRAPRVASCCCVRDESIRVVHPLDV